MTRWFPISSSGAASHVGVCILAGCALMAAATWASGDSTPRRLARGTHVGVPPSDTVMLVSQGQGTSLKFYRVNPEGTLATSEYAVPTGMRLMVTDMDFTSSYSSGSGGSTVGRLFIENRTTTTTRTLAGFISSISSGQGGTTSPLTGFSVASGGRIVADVVSSSYAPYTIYASGTYGYPQNATQQHLFSLRGYVVAEE